MMHIFVSRESENLKKNPYDVLEHATKRTFIWLYEVFGSCEVVRTALLTFSFEKDMAKASNYNFNSSKILSRILQTKINNPEEKDQDT